MKDIQSGASFFGGGGIPPYFFNRVSDSPTKRATFLYRGDYDTDTVDGKSTTDDYNRFITLTKPTQNYAQALIFQDNNQQVTPLTVKSLAVVMRQKLDNDCKSIARCALH